MGELEKYYTQQAIYCAAMRQKDQAHHYAVRAMIAREVENAYCDRETKIKRVATIRATY